jgi:hypothetical protein
MLATRLSSCGWIPRDIGSSFTKKQTFRIQSSHRLLYGIVDRDEDWISQISNRLREQGWNGHRNWSKGRW